MVARWGMADPTLVKARSSLIGTIRLALNNRYRVRIKEAETAPLLKSVDKWDSVKALFHRKSRPFNFLRPALGKTAKVI
jgi:hypothetical protein